jgi:hypothetical protein
MINISFKNTIMINILAIQLLITILILVFMIKSLKITDGVPWQF